MNDNLNFFVVCYDISSDRVRTRLADDLKDFGARRQGSVFEVTVTAERYERLLVLLSSVVLGENDSIAVYPVHDDAAKDIVYLGKRPEEEPQDVFVF